jgi:two-component system, OmpR family, response regulator
MEATMSNRTILIADDDAGMIRLLRTILEPLAVRVRETYDATGALTIIQQSPPSLVIFDVSMPGGNGLSACEMLKSDKNNARIPVIILSGRSDDATRNRCTQMGAHFVCKGPEALAEVKRLVVRLLAVNQPAGAI